MNKQLIQELNDPKNWQHLIKESCVSCGHSFRETSDHQVMRYRSRGNFCTKCDTKVNIRIGQQKHIAKLKKDDMNTI